MNSQTVSADKSGIGFRLIYILKNIFISYLITFVFLLIFAFVITYTEFPGSVISPVIVAATLISVALAGVLNGRNSSEKGWLSGSISGFLYMLILYLAGSIVFRDFSVNSHSVVMLVSGVMCGILGGIIGINNKPARKRR